MRQQFFAAAAVAVLAFGVAGAASAGPITLEGDFVKAGVNNVGTLGSGGSTSPGLLHDPTGTGTFGVNDYITPGTPHQGFSINSNETGFRGNSNAGGSVFAGAGSTAVMGAFDNMAEWSGSFGGLTVHNLYFFNDGDERINVTTTLTAATDFTNLAFATSVDPDPDVNTFGSFSTNNQRGNMLFGTSDFIGSEGTSTGLTLGILNLSGSRYTHNTRIDGFCCANIDPLTVLGGSANNTVGDHSLNMAWLIGDLGAGSSAVINYAYVVGDNIDTVGGVVPEPATWAMMIMGFGFAGATLRRRRMSFAA